MAAFITFQPSDFFSTCTWDGNSSTQTVTGAGFQPDYTSLNAVSESSTWQGTDSVRGTTNYLHWNTGGHTEGRTDAITAFNADGYAIGANGDTNATSQSYIGFNWKAGTTTGIAGSPSITPDAYSFNATVGFSIIKWTGTGANATLPHGLGKAPTMMWLKNTNGGESWAVYQKYVKASAPESWYMELDTSDATSTDAAWWNTLQPTSTLFSVGSSSKTNSTGDPMEAYCFAPIQGHSIFGRYYGNATDNGPFIQTNFRPKFVILKRLDGTTSWKIFANPNYTINTGADADAMDVNTGAARASFGKIDFVSNGFKIRDSDSIFNTNGSQNVYWAFAEFPFVSSNSKAGTAR